jgi:DNA-binding SARP family transcriptional activator
MNQHCRLVELGILGPVEARADGQALDTGHPRRRAVLAVLLLELGRTIPAQVLIDRVWGEDPPASALNTLSGYLTRLRSNLVKALEPQVTLSRQAGGYVLKAEKESLDLFRYRGLVAQAVGIDDEHGAELLRAGLGLWRGPALAGVRSRWLDAIRDTLEAERAAAVADLTDFRLRGGEHYALVGELTERAAGRPADERLIAQLMLALYRAGRQADALAWFDQTRRHLAEEVGVDPGWSLRELHERILRADPELAGPQPRTPSAVGLADQAAWAATGEYAASEIAVRGARSAGAAKGAAPRQLPAVTRHFTGREEELDRLISLAGPGLARLGGSVVIAAIDGMAGVGKTALAVQAAHYLAAQFPDGQLFIDLHGHASDREPRSPSEALDVFLRALGVSAHQVPAGAEERAALFRQRLDGTRTMIVLDNAASEAQVRPLLPGSAGCLVLVTSRRKLKGLDDADVLALGVLPQADAVALFRAVAGQDRDAAGDLGLAEAAEVVGLCGGLPLAVRIAATLLRHRPAWTPGDLARRLSDESARVGALSDGDRDLDTVLGLSYRNLTAAQRRMFRLLGLVPGPDVDALAAAALAGVEPTAAAGLLEGLADHNLLIEHAPDRYRLHDLIRLHARALASDAADRYAVFSRGDDLARILTERAALHYVRLIRSPA